VISQVGYPGAGDVDDCWVVATIWAALAADPSARRPTVPEFRTAAGNPDRPGPTGGNLGDVMLGASRTWPHLRIVRHDTAIWDTFEAKLQAGWPASLAVLSSALPSRLQFGFRGAHQVGVVWRDGTFRLANPLARTGSAPAWIAEHELHTAARTVADGAILAALFEPVPVRPATHRLRLAAGAVVRVYRLDAGVIASWDDVPWEHAASSAPCEAPVRRCYGARTVGTVRVTGGTFAGAIVRASGSGVTVTSSS
jgi:hypothetical protein